MSDGALNWRALWDDTAARVGDRQRARWLCEEASGAFGGEFHEVLHEFATDRMLAHLDAMLERLAAGEPLQYVLGHWSFRRLDLMVDRRVLIPRPETELLAGLAIERALSTVRTPDGGRRPAVCVDLGTGSGAVGLSLAFELPRGSAEVWLTDASPDALDVARANAAGLGIAGGGVRFAHGSWFDALPGNLKGALDVVVSNPPYVADGDPDVEPIVHEWEPSIAVYSGSEGLEAHRTIIDGACQWLRPGGSLLVEIGSRQGAVVAEMFRTAGLAEVAVHRDLAGHERIVTGLASGG